MCHRGKCAPVANMAANTYVFNLLLFWISVLAYCARSNPITENSSNITIATEWPPTLTVKKGFYISPHKANWYSSYMYCKSNNTRLARIESEGEYDEVVQIVKDSGKPLEWYWLGGTDMAEEGTWSWMFMGQKVKGFEKWGPGEPNNRGGREDCLNFGRKDDSYFWNDENCWEEFYFVCEFYALSTVPECVSHDQCPIDRACQASKCVDPCEDRCGSNTVCRVQQHIPTCACKAGFTGNPLDVCTEYEIKMEWPPKYPGKKKKFYIESFKKLNWYAAYFQCMRNNSRLASVESSQEHSELTALIEKSAVRNEQVWLGGSDLAIEGRWFWSQGQDLSGFTYWKSSEPNNAKGDEHCLAMQSLDSSHEWNDVPCSGENYFTCEYY